MAFSLEMQSISWFFLALPFSIKKKVRELATDSNETILDNKRQPGWVEWVRSIGIAIILALLIRWPVAEPYKIPSSSMEPTFIPGDRIFVDKHVYGIRYPLNGFRIPFTLKTLWYSDNFLKNGADIKRWEIVVFKSNEPRAEHDTLVKRVVGLPGERIRIVPKFEEVDGQRVPIIIEYRGEQMIDTDLYIDGEIMPIPDFMPPLNYTFERRSNGFALADDDEHTLIPDDHIFLMGDNSQFSRDARWFGFMPKHHVIGRVTSIWWPIPRWRDLSGYTDSIWWSLWWLSFGGYVVVRLFLGRSWSPHSNSIGGLVKKGEHLLLRFSYRHQEPFTGFEILTLLLLAGIPKRIRISRGRKLKRGDLVVYNTKEISKSYEDGLIGIVAGVPGDKVFLQEGNLFIDNESADGIFTTMSFPKEGADDKFGRSKGKEFSSVPDEHFYILTEEGLAHEDSRSLGWISEKDIIGIASRVWWPPNKIRSLNKLSDKL
jgi:signal peptidase I